MISYEGLLQKLNKGNNFPASLPGWNKSGRNFRFSESCDIIQVERFEKNLKKSQISCFFMVHPMI